MRIREYSPADLDQLKKFHSEGKFDFILPDPEEPQIVIRKCFEEGGKVRMAAFGRAQLNAYLLVDGEWKTPAERLEAIQILEFAMIDRAKALGFDQATAQVTPKFAKRLKDFGWEQSSGETWHKDF